MWGKFWWGLTFCDMNVSNYCFKIMHNCLPSFTYSSMDYYALSLRKLSCRCHTYCCTKKRRSSSCLCRVFWFLSIQIWVDLIHVRELTASTLHFEKPYHAVSFLHLFSYHLRVIISHVLFLF